MPSGVRVYVVFQREVVVAPVAMTADERDPISDAARGDRPVLTGLRTVTGAAYRYRGTGFC